ncbi:unnamed protein product [Leptidea sinapis]|uniref:BTB domain-containing protein n=1 Tax=Leptidea sinapis TaxID=189913 RepID=A0A5E4PTD0_9NEOP|nr:unnamed protein product [Leptidea sinapis]
MEDEDLQQFSLRWHNHQSSVVGALARMLSSGALSDVTLSATDGVSLRAHRLVLAACSDYFATIFKSSTISQTNPVMKDAGTNGQPTTPPPPFPIPSQTIPAPGSERRHISEHPAVDNTKQRKLTQDNGYNTSKTDRLKKLDQIVQNLYSSRLPPAVAETPPNHTSALAQIPPCHTPADRVGGEAQWRERTRRSGPVGSTIGGAVCGVCGKRLSNQYNLRVHLETHDARRGGGRGWEWWHGGGCGVCALLRLMYNGKLHVTSITKPDVNSNGQPTKTPTPSPIASQTISPPGCKRRHISEHSALDQTKHRKQLIQDNGKNTLMSDRQKKPDQIVQNVYSSRLQPALAEAPPNHMSALALCYTPAAHGGGEAQWWERMRRVRPIESAVCGVCGKRLSNRYNLRVHLETHVPSPHACRACAHVSRSRDSLRKHVAYAHPSR